MKTNKSSTTNVSPKLKKVFDTLLSGRFGDISFFKDYINKMLYGGDVYLNCYDFIEYEQAHEKIDNCYKNREEWKKKCVLSICRMGFFSSDRSIEEYAKNIWGLTKIEVPKPTLKKENRVISTSNLLDLEK